MKAADSIRHLRRGEIENAKWDRCIDEASNGLVYAYTYYLDAMATAWSALVLNDYEAVMPLPYRIKWGIAYIYQPFLTAQLGLFGPDVSAPLLSAFLHAIPKAYRYWDFSLNHRNLFPVAGFPLHERMNYVLALRQPYEVLQKGYRENIRRNVRKSGEYGLVVQTGIAVESITALTKYTAGDIPAADFDRFHRLFSLLVTKGMAKTYGISNSKGELLASAAFLFSHRRAYYLVVGNHPNGRTMGASHALIDAFIRDHAGQELLLDFEGSDIRNLAFFYSSFGASPEKYAAVRLNRLPFWARWLKENQ